MAIVVGVGNVAAAACLVLGRYSNWSPVPMAGVPLAVAVLPVLVLRVLMGASWETTSAIVQAIFVGIVCALGIGGVGYGLTSTMDSPTIREQAMAFLVVFGGFVAGAGAAGSTFLAITRLKRHCDVWVAVSIGAILFTIGWFWAFRARSPLPWWLFMAGGRTGQGILNSVSSVSFFTLAFALVTFLLFRAVERYPERSEPGLYDGRLGPDPLGPMANLLTRSLVFVFRPIWDASEWFVGLVFSPILRVLERVLEWGIGIERTRMGGAKITVLKRGRRKFELNLHTRKADSRLPTKSSKSDRDAQ
ncbi:MAG: hypothetical protein AB1696_15360 [Planctomycetota bacterium]